MKTGMTLIEIIICVMFITILGLIIAGAVGGVGTQSELTYGVNGPIETRCAGGVKVLVGPTGHPIQLLDKDGHGIPCENKPTLQKVN